LRIKEHETRLTLQEHDDDDDDDDEQSNIIFFALVGLIKNLRIGNDVLKLGASKSSRNLTP
jgi:hypothetical protein